MEQDPKCDDDFMTLNFIADSPVGGLRFGFRGKNMILLDRWAEEVAADARFCEWVISSTGGNRL
jgi:hypothetical protein